LVTSRSVSKSRQFPATNFVLLIFNIPSPNRRVKLGHRFGFTSELCGWVRACEREEVWKKERKCPAWPESITVCV
jgi:hypothetical protein